MSTATIVDGILRLFSAKPQADKDEMYKVSVEDGRNRESQLKDDGTPLRLLYLKARDNGIYSILVAFFSAVDELFWQNPASFDVMTKTIALQALFDILRLLLIRMKRDDAKDFSREVFLEKLRPAGDIDFDPLFESSGRGRTSIRNYIGLKTGIIPLIDVVNNDKFELYLEFARTHELAGIDEAIAKWTERRVG